MGGLLRKGPSPGLNSSVTIVLDGFFAIALVQQAREEALTRGEWVLQK